MPKTNSGSPQMIVRVHHRPLPPLHVFFGRLFRSALAAALFIVLALGVGVWGYHVIGGLPWVDALLNASMILAGMGPVDALKTDAAKLFASAYALFSGIAFLTSAAFLFAPLVRRFLHKFHLDLTASPEDSQ